MVGATNWGWMENNCAYGISNKFNKSNVSWGGLPIIIALGDDIQFPPVCDAPVFKSKLKSLAAMRGSLIWKEFTTVVHLQKSVRQNPDQYFFKESLSALRSYSLSKEHAQWLQSYQWDNVNNRWPDLTDRMQMQSLYIFPRHKEKQIHNKSKLLELNKSEPIAKIKSHTTGTHQSAPAAQAQGLEPILWLCKGAKVMLSLNLVDHLGLFHRSTGFIHEIIYSKGRFPPQLPDVILTEFPKYTGPSFIPGHPQGVPIVPVERKMECCNFCRRIQIPLHLAWATTIHGCQGMTVGAGENNRYIIIDPGDKKFESNCPGSLYVALSRAKTAGNQDTDPDFAFHPNLILNEDRIRHVVDTPTTRARYSEINRLLILAEETKIKHSFERTEEIFKVCMQKILNYNNSHEE